MAVEEGDGSKDKAAADWHREVGQLLGRESGSSEGDGPSAGQPSPDGASEAVERPAGDEAAGLAGFSESVGEMVGEYGDAAAEGPGADPAVDVEADGGEAGALPDFGAVMAGLDEGDGPVGAPEGEPFEEGGADAVAGAGEEGLGIDASGDAAGVDAEVDPEMLAAALSEAVPGMDDEPARESQPTEESGRDDGGEPSAVGVGSAVEDLGEGEEGSWDDDYGEPDRDGLPPASDVTSAFDVMGAAVSGAGAGTDAPLSGADASSVPEAAAAGGLPETGGRRAKRWGRPKAKRSSGGGGRKEIAKAAAAGIAVLALGWVGWGMLEPMLFPDPPVVRVVPVESPALVPGPPQAGQVPGAVSGSALGAASAVDGGLAPRSVERVPPSPELEVVGLVARQQGETFVVTEEWARATARMVMLGLDESGFNERLVRLERNLAAVDAASERLASMEGEVKSAVEGVERVESEVREWRDELQEVRGSQERERREMQSMASDLEAVAKRWQGGLEVGRIQVADVSPKAPALAAEAPRKSPPVVVAKVPDQGTASASAGGNGKRSVKADESAVPDLRGDDVAKALAREIAVRGAEGARSDAGAPVAVSAFAGVGASLVDASKVAEVGDGSGPKAVGGSDAGAADRAGSVAAAGADGPEVKESEAEAPGAVASRAVSALKAEPVREAQSAGPVKTPARKGPGAAEARVAAARAKPRKAEPLPTHESLTWIASLTLDGRPAYLVSKRTVSGSEFLRVREGDEIGALGVVKGVEEGRLRVGDGVVPGP